MPILFVSALFLEARPLIKNFKLNKLENIKNFQIFGNKNIYLLVTGTGKTNVAVGLTLAFEKLKLKNANIINFGICGSQREKIGKIFLINKITDSNTERDFYPDNLLYNHKIPQQSLLTVGKPIFEIQNYELRITSNKNHLIDMEGSAFFETASFFVRTDQIFLLKIVSDNLNQVSFDKAKTQEIIEKNIDIVIEFLVILEKNKEIVSFQKMSSLKLNNNFFNKIHLTTTQKVQFQNKFHDISIQKNQNIQELLELLTLEIDLKKNKKENGKKVFRKLEEMWEGTY